MPQWFRRRWILRLSSTSDTAGGAGIEAWSFTPGQRRDLFRLLLELYPARDALERLFYLELGRPLGTVAAEKITHEQLILTVLQTAERDGWAVALVEGIVQDRPEHAAFQAWARANLTRGRSPQQPAADRETVVLDLDELRDIVETAVGGRTQVTFDSIEISGTTATLFLSQPGVERLIVLRVEGFPLARRSDQARFHTQVGRARRASAHARVANILSSGFTQKAQPYVLQMVDQKVGRFELPRPASEVLDIGADLADALSVAHAWGAPFGEIELSHVLRTPGGNPVLILPQLPMFAGGDRVAPKPHEEVYRLCEVLFAMLDPTPSGAAIEEKLRARLTLAMRGNLIAGALRDQLEILRRESAPPHEYAQLLARFPMNEGASDGALSIVSGDLFNQDGDIIVGFSDTFDTSTAGSLVISPASLQGQLVQRVFGGDVGALDGALDRALAGVTVRSVESRDAKPHGKLRRYPIGTVAAMEHGDRRIFAIAVSRMGNNLTAGSSAQFLRDSLTGLWPVVRTYSADRSVAMPVIGAGLSRVELSREKLIGLILSSYRTQARVTPVCRELRIVAHPSDLDATDPLGIA